MIFSSIGGLAIFVTVGIPILGLMLLITRWFSSYRIPEKWRTNLRLTWIISFVLAVLTVLGTVSSFNQEADVSAIEKYGNNDEVLLITKKPTKYHKPLGFIGAALPSLTYTRGGLIDENVHFDVIKSKGDEIVVETNLHAHGRSFSEAQSLVKNINATHELVDNVLKIPKDFRINKGDKFRSQRVQFVIHIPEGKNVKFDKSVADIIWDHGYFRDRIRPKNLEKYVWTMTDKGLASVGWDKEYRAERFIDANSLENLNISGKIATTIQFGDKTEILVTGPKTEIEKIEKVETDGATSLIVGGWLSDRVTLQIKTPILNSLQAKDLKSLKIEGFKQKEMELNFSGKRQWTEINAYIDIENLVCNVGGSNVITLLGSGQDLMVNILDGSRIVAEQYKAKNVTVKGNIYNNSSFYASDSFKCPEHEKHSITLYGNAELLADNK